MITKLPTLVSDAETRLLESDIVTEMARHNMALPSNFSFDAPGSIDMFLAVVKTANLARAKREAEEAARPDPDVTTGEGIGEGPAQFSEADAPQPAPPITRMSPAQARAFIATDTPWTKK